MIIKGIFRRYERWNPVHPTLGAFWGMGIGVGCGVGWGPGFGPEVIGYVGAGCGVGFSVGVTFAGIGIGLPVNGALQLRHSEPFHAPACISRGNTLEVARSNALSMMSSVAVGFKLLLAPYTTLLMKNTFVDISRIKKIGWLFQPVEVNKFNKAISGHLKSTADFFHGFRDQGWPPGLGTGTFF
ncbi:Cadmium-induced protein AS8 [Platanthera guangdongensis]|uniref:Cadmium-induced protein AS8 n=1 Tax=Platanthera guangdongensis TaxID=2320717 RepID=A0ABR2MDT0_9ASPA